MGWNMETLGEQLPPHLVESLTAYVNERRPVGSFLTAILSNDLCGAVNRADDVNIRLLPEWVRYVYNYIPGNCWGSPEHVSRWLGGEDV